MVSYAAGPPEGTALANGGLDDWARRSNLALAPLFESEAQKPEGFHLALLDGAAGSFALSDLRESDFEALGAAAWAWSSHLPHHVAVTQDKVRVTRWDRPTPREFPISVFKSDFESFYSFLLKDRVGSSHTVVEHLLNVFRRMRSLVASAGIEDEHATQCFLEFFDQLIEAGGRDWKSRRSRSDAESGVLSALPENGVEALIEDSVRSGRGPELALFPSLAVRHAGSAIFQEAHFELARASAPDLFGYVDPARAHLVTHGGAHFTPPALGRMLAEQTLRAISDIREREVLTLLDPACGSGSILHEALRVLKRWRFRGRVVVRGLDVSAPAVAMARFVLKHSASDWTDGGGIDVEVEQCDALDEELPRADVVLMNPPFITWGSLGEEQRTTLKAVLGSTRATRPDYSMGFVLKALDEALRDGSVLGALLPASVLTSESALPWRRGLLDRANLRLLASLGHHHLFPHAIVQVTGMVLSAGATDGRRPKVTTLRVGAGDMIEAGDALRALRGYQHGSGARESGERWELFEAPAHTFAERATWRPIQPSKLDEMARLWTQQLRPVSELFDVHQGVQTGYNRAFLLKRERFKQLRSKERAFFRPAIVNDSVRGARLCEGTWVFYPYDEEGCSFANEEAVKAAVPSYYEKVLVRFRTSLAGRAAVRRQEGKRWWELSWPRLDWTLRPAPKIVSKFFGGPGAFAVDRDAEFVVVQGHAWILKENPEDAVDSVALDDERVLNAYCALLNSRYFRTLLDIFCPVVAGGQYDLSRRYVEQVPLPDLSVMFQSDAEQTAIQTLSELGSKPLTGDWQWEEDADDATQRIYGGVVDEVGE